jgi:hypothetical protein
MPKGTVIMLAEKLMEDDAEDIVRAVVSAAKAGDPTAMQLCIERLAPVRKGRPITFDLPDIETDSDITKALGMIAFEKRGRSPSTARSTSRGTSPAIGQRSAAAAHLQANRRLWILNHWRVGTARLM